MQKPSPEAVKNFLRVLRTGAPKLTPQAWAKIEAWGAANNITFEGVSAK